MKMPSALVIAVRTTLEVPFEMMRTSAPGTTAPLESRTVPVMAPVAPPCAYVRPESERTQRKETTMRLNLFKVHPPPCSRTPGKLRAKKFLSHAPLFLTTPAGACGNVYLTASACNAPVST